MTQQLDHIEQKIRQLLEELQTLQQQYATLTLENKRLKTEHEAHEERIGELAQRLTDSQQALAGQRGDTSETTQKLRKQMDQYIAEIDKCIEWLQNA